MRRRRIHSLVVVLNDSESRYGILTSTDIRDKILAAERQPAEVAVREIMTAPVLTAQADWSLTECSRRMQAALEQDERIADFWVRASHMESLHPHDAVAVATKGVPGGYSAVPDGLLPR